MVTLLLVPLAAVSIMAAGYAQYRVPFHSPSRTSAALTRLILAGAGAGLGTVNALAYAALAPPLLVFLASFGIVHVPAAVILSLKRRRGYY